SGREGPAATATTETAALTRSLPNATSDSRGYGDGEPSTGSPSIFTREAKRMTGFTAQVGPGRLHAAMAAHVAKSELPGMVTLVAHGEDVEVDAIGVMAFASNEPMRRDTIF